MLRRSSFTTKPPERRQATQSTTTPRPRVPAPSAGLLALLAPELEPVDPHDGEPTTAAGRRHMGRVAALGCLLCRRLGQGHVEPQVHHLRTGIGKAERAPDHLVIPLCEPHHTGPTGIHGLGLRGFERRYGVDELGLLAETIHLLTEGTA